MKKSSHLGRVLILVNLTSHSYDANQNLKVTTDFFKENPEMASSVEVYETSQAGDAEIRARECKEIDTLLVLAGDGTVHEAVNGLMQREKRDRPSLAVIPTGTGNDFARTVGMYSHDVGKVLTRLKHGHIEWMDIGKVNDTYFMETLSFGLDAAIAIDTIKKRREGTHAKGTKLFVQSSIRVLSKKTNGWNCRLSLDGGREERLPVMILAFQIGRTYGAGIPIAPDADPRDGLFDICMNRGMMSAAYALFLFALAKFGRHKHSKKIRMARAGKARVCFDTEVPVQTDGEEMSGREFMISMLPGELSVWTDNDFGGGSI